MSEAFYPSFAAEHLGDVIHDTSPYFRFRDEQLVELATRARSVVTRDLAIEIIELRARIAKLQGKADAST
jgi:hypothetical protein